MIEVEESKVLERSTIPVHCDYCGDDSEMVLEAHQAGDRVVYRVNVTICCGEVRDRANEIDLEEGMSFCQN